MNVQNMLTKWAYPVMMRQTLYKHQEMQLQRTQITIKVTYREAGLTQFKGCPQVLLSAPPSSLRVETGDTDTFMDVSETDRFSFNFVMFLCVE